MPGKCRPSLRDKTLENVMRSSLSSTDKECIKAVFERYEAEPVKHSRWRKDHDGDEYCENCARYMPSREVTGDPSATDYCPNCGAKMDGGDAEDVTPKCKDCIHFEVCSYVDPYLPVCDSYADPVKHGRWLQPKPGECFCSECQTNGSPQWKRCPVCEAKMSGGK